VGGQRGQPAEVVLKEPPAARDGVQGQLPVFGQDPGPGRVGTTAPRHAPHYANGKSRVKVKILLMSRAGNPGQLCRDARADGASTGETPVSR
jgi:hypothetical protein